MVEDLFSSTLSTPPPVLTGILYSRQSQKTKMAASLVYESHGKIGDCEQSMSFEEQITSKEKYPSMFSRHMKAVVFI